MRVPSGTAGEVRSKMVAQLNHAIRATGIGASEIAAIVNVSPWDTPLDVYRRKVVGDHEKPDAEPLRWGRLLENVIAERYAEHTGLAIIGDGCETFRHPDYSWMLATPDRLTADRSRLVEIKNVSARNASAWGDPEREEFPDHYRIQVLWQMAVTGIHAADLVCLVGGDAFRIYPVTWHADLAELLIESGRAFWEEHVLAGVPPAPTDLSEMPDYLALRYPRDSGEVVEADDELEQLADRLLAAREVLALATVEKAEAESAIKAWLGETSEVRGRFGRMTWKATKPARATDWRRVAEALTPSLDLIAAHTTEKPGCRRFCVYPNVEE